MQVSLARGSGARRLNLAKSRSSIQLLLVQACGEIWAAHGHRLEQQAVIVLLDVLQLVRSNAQLVNGDGNLRRELALAQMRDEVHIPPSSLSHSVNCSASSLSMCADKLLKTAHPFNNKSVCSKAEAFMKLDCKSCLNDHAPMPKSSLL